MPVAKKTTTTRKPRDRKLTVNETIKVLETLTMGMRGAVSAYLGKSYGGDRDIYTALGYTKDPSFAADYLTRYKRQDIAKAVVDVPVRACWRETPTLTESAEKPTKFGDEWIKLAAERSVFHYLSRCDRLASIGQYSALLLGLEDGLELSEPAMNPKSLLYLMPYDQSAATIDTYEEDTANERYGQVKQYKIDMSVGTSGSSISKQVHWSRVIHVSEDNLASDVFGTPRLEAVLNRLYDLELISGGSAEMFWRGGFPGFGLKVDKDSHIGKQDLQALETEMKEYIDGLKRYIRLEGISIEELKPQVADPSNHVSVILDLISAAARIPRRILLGSERGELASSQDEKNWAKRVAERQHEHCEAKMIRPLVDRLIDFKVLPEPSEGYTVDWPDILTTSDKEKAEVAEMKARAIKHYVDAIGTADLIPATMFLKHVMGFSQDEIDQIDAAVGEQQLEADSDDDITPEET